MVGSPCRLPAVHLTIAAGPPAHPAHVLLILWRREHQRGGIMRQRRHSTPLRSILAFALWASLVATTCAAAPGPQYIFPKTSLGPDDIAVIVNDADPQSRRVGDYYQARRNIPAANVIHVRFRAGATDLSRAEFARITREVAARTPAAVQASALALGFDPAFCSQHCASTMPSPYFNSAGAAPYSDYGLRPTMALAGRDFEQVKALIDRGVASDAAHQRGTGYLLSTSDKARNVRAAIYPAIVKRAAEWVDLEIVQQDAIENKKDVLFYFTGRAQVPGLDTLRFVPGAIADHLTSAGGQLIDSSQMSSLRWLEAGATGSCGAVVARCNPPGKFPNPALAIFWYLQGETVIEAYWMSVAMPGEGIFIGEPLANPFGGYSLTVEDAGVILRTQALPAGIYVLEGADSGAGPYQAVTGRIVERTGRNELRLGHLDKALYRLVRVQ